MSDGIPTNDTPTSASIYRGIKPVRVSPGKCCGFPFAGTAAATAAAAAAAIARA